MNEQKVALPQKPDATTDLIVYEPMPGGSCLLEQIMGRWRKVAVAALMLSSPVFAEEKDEKKDEVKK